MFKRFKGNSKGLFFTVCFRCTNFFTKSKLLRIIGFPIRLLYRIGVNWILGIDVPDTVRMGKNVIVWHGIGVIIHPKTIIGDNVTIRHNTTIGNAKHDGGAPIIGDGVDIGANVVIIGEIEIGNYAVIGAGAVVTKSIPPYAVVVGNPARIVKIKS